MIEITPSHFEILEIIKAKPGVKSKFFVYLTIKKNSQSKQILESIIASGKCGKFFKLMQFPKNASPSLAINRILEHQGFYKDQQEFLTFDHLNKLSEKRNFLQTALDYLSSNRSLYYFEHENLEDLDEK